MHKVEKNFLEQIEKYNMLNHNDKIVLGLSGGADSVALFTLITDYNETYKKNLDIYPVHINHGLRANSYIDEEFCVDLCKSKGLNCIVHKVDLLDYCKQHSLSTEDAGRKFRYKAFNSTIDNPKIFIAHNEDDNAETVLINLIRGTGLTGITGIKSVLGNVYRPLLTSSKENIYDFLKCKKIKNIEDESNKKNDYTRNKFRNIIIPELKNINSNVSKNIYTTTEILSDEENYINSIVAKKFNQLYKNNCFDLIQFNNCHIAEKRRLIRMYIEHISTLQNISYSHIENIISICLYNNGQKQLNLPNNIIAKKSYTTLKIEVIQKEHYEHYEHYEIPLGLDELVCIPNTNKHIIISKSDIESNLVDTNKFSIVSKHYFSYNNIETFVLRNRKNGDKLFIPKSNKYKKLKEHFIKNKIPRDLRDKLPLIAEKNSNNVLLLLQDIKKSQIKQDYTQEKLIYVYIMEEKDETN